jgi:hypothetical protein
VNRSFFHQVTAHAARRWQDPKENRLTAAFAATLRENPGVAARLAAEWIGHDISAPVAEVTVQRPTRGGVIDLELRFGSSVAP